MWFLGRLAVPLTVGAYFHILDDILLRILPPVVLSNIALSVPCSQMSTVWCSMNLIHDSLFKVQVFWHTDLSAPHPNVINSGEVFGILFLIEPGM